MATSSLFLLLADGRFPAGAHAHSGGLEAAVAAGRVTDLATLEAFLAGRLATAGLVGAAFAAAAHRAVTSAVPPYAGPRWRCSTRSWTPRTAAPALRTVSRRQGRALLRAGRSIWPEACFHDLPATPGGAHQPLVLGLLCAAAGLSRAETATVATHGTVTGAASAAVRLLGLDPYRVQALLVGLADLCDGTAAEAARAADDPPERLPAAAAPLADIHAQAHATWEVRLFAS
ncbi:urease accessory protein UreF [Micromonospora provocatoris]|nr:urease accessory UreF family protein [Micromonospora provocatoris]RBJ10979.1 urease accessory protein UreF [Micromonospora provocatoris]